MATTLKLPAELKERVAEVARKVGKSPHAFMIEAIEQQTSMAERRRSFLEDAYRSRQDTERTGLGHPAEDVHRYVAALARGEKPPRPRPRKWRK